MNSYINALWIKRKIFKTNTDVSSQLGYQLGYLRLRNNLISFDKTIKKKEKERKNGFVSIWTSRTSRVIRPWLPLSLISVRHYVNSWRS